MMEVGKARRGLRCGLAFFHGWGILVEAIVGGRYESEMSEMGGCLLRVVGSRS